MKILFTGHKFHLLTGLMQTHDLVLYCHCCCHGIFLVRIRGCNIKGSNDTKSYGSTIEEAIDEYIDKINGKVLINGIEGEIEVGQLL